MKFQPILILVLLHLLLSGTCVVLILAGKTSLRKEQLIPIIGLPLFGPIMAFVIELLNISGIEGKKPVDLEPVSLHEDILWKALKNYHEKGDIVPLEEAILIDDVQTRRKFMLTTLYEDPLKYLDILMLAKNNDDIETSHYATTTISYAQRGFQVAIQELAIAVDNYPDDRILMDRYIETLEKYINSGLLEEHLLRNLRVVYKDALDKQLARVKNDRTTLIRKLRNSIELNEYASAFEASDLLKKSWPEDEQTWIEAVRACVEGKDRNQLHELLQELRQTNVDWTKEGKEQVSAWVNGALT